MALALLVLGRAARLPLRRLQRWGDARLLVLVLHDGPVKHVVPLEACMHSPQPITTHVSWLCLDPHKSPDGDLVSVEENV